MKLKHVVALCLIPTVGLAQEYGTVKSSSPNYRTYKVPSQTCQEIIVSEPSTDYGINAGTFIGGVAGGLLGNQVGRGNGNVAATAIGAVVGAIAGGNMGRNTQHDYEGKTRTHCTTTYEQRQEVRDFNVTVDYKGVAIPVTMTYPPTIGDRVPVQIVVQ